MGTPAPEIGLPSFEGDQIQLGLLRGKVLMIDFWASWCTPCADAIPFLQRLYDGYRDQGFVVVGISVDRSMQSARRFALKTGAAFPLVHDSDGWAVSRYNPPRMPTTYFVDRRGIVRYVHKGFEAHDEDQIEGLLRQLLAEHP